MRRRGGAGDRARIAAWVLAACGLVACDRCGAPGVAELLESDGAVDRNVAATEAWSSAPIGQRFEIGDAVRTGDASTARLRIGARGGVRMQPATILRFFGERPERGAHVQLETGQVELDSEEALDVETAMGSVRLEPGARVVVREGEGGSRVEVIAGRVVFEDEGEERTAEAGDTIVLEVGRVVFEDADAAAGADDSASAAEAASAAADASARAEAEAAARAEEALAEAQARAETEAEAEGEADAELDGDAAGGGPAIEAAPARAHLEIPAGESPTIHDPGGTPTAVGIAFGEACTGRGVVALRAGRRVTRWAGEGRAIVLVPPGRARYSIDCASGSDPRGGSITVRRDDGSTRLESVPPRNVVDSDGRTYDVLYQNALPILTVRWREATGASVLHVTTGSRARTFPAPGGRVELRSGEVGEGTHRLWLTAGGRRSPETTLRIRFDNAAPTATLREPSRGASLVPGATVHVAGAVLPDTAVRAGASELSIDPQHRFSADVTVPSESDALVIRFSHRRRGVHYYLRRVAGR